MLLDLIVILTIFETRSQCFDFSARSLGHVTVWLVKNDQDAGAGSRSGAVGNTWYPCLRLIEGVFLDVDRFPRHFPFGSLVTLVLSSETECPVALQWSLAHV